MLKITGLSRNQYGMYMYNVSYYILLNMINKLSYDNDFTTLRLTFPRFLKRRLNLYIQNP